ncbi:putative ribonuclease H-like domain-containing protein [Tanacetum coccineum]
MRPFRCPVIILNTNDHLGKFIGKADEGFFVRYSLNSKAFRVFNSRTRIVEENLHIRFSESTPNVAGSGPYWLFEIDALIRIMNYELIVAGIQFNGFSGTKASDNAGQARKEIEPVKDYILLPLWTADPLFSQDPKSSHDDGSKPSSDDGKKVDEDPRKDSECNDQEKEDNVNYTINAASINEVNVVADRVYKVEKALYGLHQAPRAWYENLSTYMLDNEFQRGKIDKTLFIKRYKSDILLVRVYVDDIIFGLTKKELCNAFEKLMHEKFQMSFMGELTFFLGLQVKQKKDGVFISQDKYVGEILKKFGFTEVKTASTPMETQKLAQDRKMVEELFENVSKTSNDPLLARGNTLQSGEDSLKLQELMELYTNLQQRVLALETTKTTQAMEIASLKKRVNKLERKNKSRTHRLKRLYKVGSSRRVEYFEDEVLGEEDASKQGRIDDIDANEDIYLVNVQTDEDMFGVNDLDCDEVIVKSVDVVKTAEERRSVDEEVIAITIPVCAAITTTTITAITNVEMTLAQALAELKSEKPKADKFVIQEPEQGTTTPTLTTTTVAITITAASTRPRSKGLDVELAFKLQAKEEEEKEEEEKERLTREKAQHIKEANIA